MRHTRQVNWPAVGAVAAATGASAALVVMLRQLVPQDAKLSVTIAILGAIMLTWLAYLMLPVVRAYFQRRGRLIRTATVAFAIPVSAWFLMGRSTSATLAASIQALCILIIVQVSREWRTMRPARTVDWSSPLSWGGIEMDEVGRGPRSRTPDGVPDANFKLRLSQSKNVVKEIVLRRLTPDGDRARERWRSRPHWNDWVLGVVVAGVRQEPDPSGDLNIRLGADTEIDLYASDACSRSKWFVSGQRYEVEVRYIKADMPPDIFRTMIT